MIDPNRMHLDQDKARALVAEALAQRPDLRILVGSPIRGPRIRCDLMPAKPGGTPERVIISVRIEAGDWVPVWLGPRHYVELAEPAVVQ
jgi:hypothetical protein